MKKIYAFTLAETVIVFVVIGVISTLLLGALTGLQPDREKTMFKKAYQITERTVGELVNDESIYPYDPERIGFLNKDKAFIEGTNNFLEGDGKFCQFFARKLNTMVDPVYDAATKQCTFQTTDSISWIVPSGFDSTVSVDSCIGSASTACTPTTTILNNVITITIDVNGSEIDGGGGPNTRDDVHGRDMFDIIVEFDGKVRAGGSKEIEYLRSHDANRARN